MSIKYGITQWSLSGEGIFEIKYAADAGLDGLQLDLGSYQDGFRFAQIKNQNDYLNEAAKYGIDLTAIAINDLDNYCFINSDDIENQEIAVKSMLTAIDAAKAMNIDTVLFPVFANNEISKDAQMINAAKVLKTICEIAGESGIQISLEIGLSPEKQIELLQAVDMKNINIMYDSQNYYFFGGHNQLDMLRQIYPYIGTQLHLKDGTGRDDTNGILAGALLGQGDSNLIGTVDYLKEKRYSGWIILENEYFSQTMKDINDNQVALIKEDLRYLKSVLE